MLYQYEPITVEYVAARCKISVDVARARLASLAERGYLRSDGEVDGEETYGPTAKGLLSQCMGELDITGSADQ